MFVIFYPHVATCRV